MNKLCLVRGGVVYSINEEVSQNCLFNQYPDFHSILIDWDRNLGNTGGVVINGHTVDALSRKIYPSNTYQNYYLNCITNTAPINYLIGGNFQFYGGEEIGKKITARFFNKGSGSGTSGAFTATPSIYLVHPDGTLSEEIVYKTSEQIPYSSSSSKKIVSYFDTSDTTLVAQEGDVIVLKLSLVGISGDNKALWTHANEGSVNPISFQYRSPIQISVE